MYSTRPKFSQFLATSYRKLSIVSLDTDEYLIHSRGHCELVVSSVVMIVVVVYILRLIFSPLFSPCIHTYLRLSSPMQ